MCLLLPLRGLAVVCWLLTETELVATKSAHTIFYGNRGANGGAVESIQ
jgi:hypothetical protein